MGHTGKLPLALIALSAAFAQQREVNPGNPSTLEDFQAGDQNREALQRATDLVAATHASSGDWVADVGAGAGYYSMRLSKIVGPTGKVFAEDISTSMLEKLDLRVTMFHLANVEIIHGDDDDPKLPSGSLAAVLVVNSYHHFEKYQAMCEQILQSLKPGGRLVIADYSLPAYRQKSRADQLKIHEIDPELLRAELTQAGFRVLSCQDPFVNRMPDAAFSYGPKEADLYLMVAVRPQ
jgi:ubiquinone/menaquinone biosynthesis C-methylase UbiE